VGTGTIGGSGGVSQEVAGGISEPGETMVLGVQCVLEGSQPGGPVQHEDSNWEGGCSLSGQCHRLWDWGFGLGK